MKNNMPLTRHVARSAMINDIYISAEIIALAIGALGLYHIIINTGRHKLASELAVPATRWILEMI